MIWIIIGGVILAITMLVAALINIAHEDKENY